MANAAAETVPHDGPDLFLNRELSWLAFARRVLELSLDSDLPLLERVKFVGIMGMLHDEFFMKRISGLKRQVRQGAKSRSPDGRSPAEELAACRREIRLQMEQLSRVVREDIRPALARAGIPILDHAELTKKQAAHLREYFVNAVLPLLTPLAVDAEHPFPFISGRGLNLAILVQAAKGSRPRFVRLKVPANRPRWLRVPETDGCVPIEQVIGANLDLLLPGERSFQWFLFRVTRGAEGETEEVDEIADSEALLPGGIIRQVTRDLKARRFAGVTRLKVDAGAPPAVLNWLREQLKVDPEDVYATDTLLGLEHLLDLRIPDHEELMAPPHRPVTHARLRNLDPAEPAAIFAEIAAGDILLHHPYHSFDTSVLSFLAAAARDPAVLAIKLTIYRTNSDSPIIHSLVEAARNGKQVAVLVEITARFDEAPNIAWGRLLEKEGVHVAYGVEQLKTHVKLALVIREEAGGIRNYAHVGTGNYHSGTARIYEDLGLLTCDPALGRDVARLFNQLTGALPMTGHEKLIVAPRDMRTRFVQLIRREAEHARAGRECGIRAKMNQLQDPEMIRELYAASQAGVPVALNVRGLCCLRPGVPGLSESIRVFSVVGRFLEHARVYEFRNGGQPEYFLGSADWMRRNLDRRVECVAPVEDPAIRRQLAQILDVYEADNDGRWDCDAAGAYTRRRPAAGEPPRGAQRVLAQLAAVNPVPPPADKRTRRARKT